MDHQPPPFFKRGPSAAARLSFLAFLCVAMMIADARLNALYSVRTVLSAVLLPLQRIARSPVDLAARTGEFFVTQARLQRENSALRQWRLVDSAKLLRYQALQAENIHLRSLLAAKQHIQESAVLAEIVYAGHDPFNRKVTVDKGEQDHVKAGQAVLDDAGVVGQVTRTFAFSSEVTLLTDKDQAVPVQLMRNGLRAIVFGFGQDGTLELRYMSVHADIQTGDVLVTSGIDGTYPPGLPVAVVSKIERNSAYAFAKIVCTPSAGTDRNRQLLILTAPPPQGPAVKPAAATPTAVIVPTAAAAKPAPGAH